MLKDKFLYSLTKFATNLGSLLCSFLVIGRTIAGMLCPNAWVKGISNHRHLCSVLRNTSSYAKYPPAVILSSIEAQAPSMGLLD